MQVSREQQKHLNRTDNSRNNFSSGSSQIIGSSPTRSVAQRVMEVTGKTNGEQTNHSTTSNNIDNLTSSTSNQVQNIREVKSNESRQANDLTHMVCSLGLDECGELVNETQSGDRMENHMLKESMQDSSTNRISNKMKCEKNSSNQIDHEPKLSPRILVEQSSQKSPTLSGAISQNQNNSQVKPSSIGPQFEGTISLSTVPNLISSDSVFKQILAKNFHPDHKSSLCPVDNSTEIDKGLESGSKAKENHHEPRISLETKVPHPFEVNQFSSSESNSRDAKQVQEVCYYNDEAINSTRGKLNLCDSHKIQQQNCYNSDEHLYDTNYDIAACYHNSNMIQDQIRRRDLNGDLDCTDEEESPKAKSAPATPCNVTPTAFHQHSSYLDSTLDSSPANTLPTDIWRKIRIVTPSAVPMGAQSQAGSLQYLEDLIRRGEALLDEKNYDEAVDYFNQWEKFATLNQGLQYRKKFFKVFSLRADAHFSLGRHEKAIEDSIRARELNPRWVHSYYREGRAQLILGKYEDSLVVLSLGLAQEPNNKRILESLVDSALKSPLKSDFDSKYQKLKALNLHRNSFVVTSIIGQELLSKGYIKHAIVLLESALDMGPSNSKLKGSVYSAIAHGHFKCKEFNEAIRYLQRELKIETELYDVDGQCRVLSNLGYIYYRLHRYDESIKMHRKQIDLGMKANLYKHVCSALNALGHIHSALSNFNAALTSHSRCLELMKELGESEFTQFKELISIGYIHSMLGDLRAAEARYADATHLLKCISAKISEEEYLTGQIMIKFNLALIALKKQSLQDAKQCYDEVIQLARQMSPPKRNLYEMRASMGLGHAFRLFRKFDEARVYFLQQLELAESLDDLKGRSQALCNLGMIYQYYKDYQNASKFFENNLALVSEEPMLLAYAHSYMGSMAYLTNHYNEAQLHYEKSLALFKELDNCSSERKTVDLNMAAVRERMGLNEPISNPANLSGQPQSRKVLIA